MTWLTRRQISTAVAEGMKKHFKPKLHKIVDALEVQLMLLDKDVDRSVATFHDDLRDILGGLPPVANRTVSSTTAPAPTPTTKVSKLAKVQAV